MSAQFGSDKIGAMQYSGLDIAEARYNGQVVFKAKPNLSPATLGAVHWLPFTNSPTEDIGTSPGVWGTNGTMTVSGGALTSGMVRNPSPSTYTPIQGCAFTCWLVPTDTSSFANTVPNVFAENSILSMSYVGTSRAVSWQFRRGANVPQRPTAGTLTTGWNFVAGCMEPVSGTTWRYRGYINGTEVVNATYDAGTQGTVSFRYPSIDAAYAQVDDFAVYNRALTAAEVTSLHQLGRTT